MRAVRAFTLIELLIVVAIIAILAAIAVPNFLEAQVRSKISRQVSNLRTATVALEAYRVDHKSYPATTHQRTHGGSATIRVPSGVSFAVEASWWKVYPGYQGYYHGITTPVAYLSSNDTLIDIFRLGHKFAEPLHYQMMYLPTHYYFDHSVYAAQKARYGEWVMRSSGPDTYYQNYGHLQGDYTAGGWNRGSYDASNGTISAGDIYRSQMRPDEDHPTS